MSGRVRLSPHRNAPVPLSLSCIVYGWYGFSRTPLANLHSYNTSTLPSNHGRMIMLSSSRRIVGALLLAPSLTSKYLMIALSCGMAERASDTPQSSTGSVAVNVTNSTCPASSLRNQGCCSGGYRAGLKFCSCRIVRNRFKRTSLASPSVVYKPSGGRRMPVTPGGNGGRSIGQANTTGSESVGSYAAGWSN
jgi:hypothetical protein